MPTRVHRRALHAPVRLAGVAPEDVTDIVINTDGAMYGAGASFKPRRGGPPPRSAAMAEGMTATAAATAKSATRSDFMVTCMLSLKKEMFACLQ